MLLALLERTLIVVFIWQDVVPEAIIEFIQELSLVRSAKLLARNDVRE
jgi:hypothetical protein